MIPSCFLDSAVERAGRYKFLLSSPPFHKIRSHPFTLPFVTSIHPNLYPISMHISFITTLLLSLPLLALSAPKYLSPDSPLAAGWSIKSFTRNIKDPLIGIYNFNIDNGVDKPIPCSINDTVVAPALAATHSWYDIGCNEVCFPFSFLASLNFPQSHPGDADGL